MTPLLDAPPIRCFLSYARQDDVVMEFVGPFRDSLRHLAYADRGRDLEIFLDREAIGWGDLAQPVIRASVRSATVFATQAPKGLDNRITGNATTQIFGRLGSPAQIRAAEEVARAKGSAVPDIARLTRGEFFVATDATGFHLTTVPMCLSHHPPSPLTADEVIDRARR